MKPIFVMLFLKFAPVLLLLALAVSCAGHPPNFATPTRPASVSTTTPALSITTSNPPAGTAGTDYSEVLAATGGVAPFTWAVAAGALPTGLSLNASSGVISGSPTTSGSFGFTVQVSDSAAQIATAQLAITINEASVGSVPPPLTITTTSLPSGTTGVGYSATLTANGGAGAYNWTITMGTLPAGLSLVASSGLISGTPTKAGTFNFTAQVTDSAGHTQSTGFSITVNSAAALTITTTTLPSGTAGTAYNATLSASGGTTPYTWTITTGALPPGLSLGATTGSINGTPTSTGAFNFTVQVTDSSGLTQSAGLSITIGESNVIQHVVIVVEENKSFAEVIGNTTDMPYLNSLAGTYAYGVNYYASILSSQGDYFMLTVGELLTTTSSFTGVTTDDNVVRHLINAGVSWKAYAESLPYTGYLGGDQYPYSKIHNPFVYISDVVYNQAQADNVVPFSQMATDLANGNLPGYSFVIPNAQSDGHDCPPGMSTCSLDEELSYTDSWLKNNMGPLLANVNFQEHGVLIVTWDESDGSSTNGGGQVAWVIVGDKVKRGYQGTGFYQHQSTLKLMMQALGLTSFPNAASNAPSMSEFFSSTIP